MRELGILFNENNSIITVIQPELKTTLKNFWHECIHNVCCYRQNSIDTIQGIHGILSGGLHHE